MTHNPCLTSKHVHRFPLFSITASVHIKVTSALMLWHGLTQVTHIKISLFSRRGQRTLVSTDSYTSCSSPLFLSLSLLLVSNSLWLL
ncbi:unnamed protein product [Hymenolepis diminuta]|uniref:Uncharacterized protein n=1 Tax=Hymenolepis diminuta TaxID=6216 RepID=A0A564Z6J3_HYMDI|nr:unnamed protein product [Hymenolepis diminuta]